MFRRLSPSFLAALVVCALLLAPLLAAWRHQPPKGAVPFTEPAAGQFRIGFQGEKDISLEFYAPTPEMGKEYSRKGEAFYAAYNNNQTAPAEEVVPASPRLWPSAPPLNPRLWTVLTLGGAARRLSFPSLIWVHLEIAGPEWLLRSSPRNSVQNILSQNYWNNDQKMVFALAYTPSKLPRVRLAKPRTAPTRNNYFSTTPVPDHLRASAEQHTDGLLAKYNPGRTKSIWTNTWSVIEAAPEPGGRTQTLWLASVLLNPNCTMCLIETVYGLYVEEGNVLRPYYALEKELYEGGSPVFFVAAVDLDGDGADELVVRVQHLGGHSYKVLQLRGDTFSVIYRSAFVGT